MEKRIIIILCLFLSAFTTRAQQIKRFNPDTIRTIVIDSAVNIVSHRLRAQDFIDAVVHDTSFYKAFQDMKRYDFIAENRVYTYDKKNRITGRLYRKIKHNSEPYVDKVTYLAKQDTGTIYKKDGKYQLYTVELFDHIFMNAYKTDYTKTNGIPTGGPGQNEGYKGKLKALIFTPGRRISGIPFISSKTEIFGPELKQYYNYEFARGRYMDSIPVYRFKVIRKPSTADGDTMIKEMTTIFDINTFQILGRYIDMKFSNLLIDFNVQMNIELNRFNGELLPTKISCQSSWNVPFHKEERASFLIVHKDYATQPPKGSAK